MADDRPIYGLMAEFDDPTSILSAARKAYAEGYRSMDAFSPYPVHGLSEAIGFTRNQVPLLALVGGIVGGLGGFFMQYWISVIDYPLNVGGRPFNSWPMFIPITFECTILVAAFSAVLGMLALNGLPRPHHPVFNVDAFKMASQSRFFLCIESKDPQFDRYRTQRFLEELSGKVTDVELD